MRKALLCFIGCVVLLLCGCATSSPSTPPSDVQSAEENNFLSHVHQLVTDGKRSGEGYFSQDGKELVFQSEQEPGNPFYQIYLMDLETGNSHRVSPGMGKTTCSWIHPSQDKIIFASTHSDPKAEEKQKQELEARASGKSRPYQWDYDSEFDIYETTRAGKAYRNLTHVQGYDAEGSYSPDGTHIAFASNRNAYLKKLGQEDTAQLAKDPSYFVDIFLMKADGSEVRQLTTSAGYDGGPFFSPDGEKIIWRRFAVDGRSAEVYTMNLDGTEQKQITNLQAMSWAPYFHPSGDYIVFTTSVHGHRNFELYVVDAKGTQTPVRVSTNEGFDGLPVFSPDGKKLVWSSSRGSDHGSQLFIADWNDGAAREALGG